MSSIVGEAAALGSAFLWALSSTLMGALSGRMPAVVIATVRALFGSAFLVVVLAVLLLAGDVALPPMPTLLALAASGALGLGVGDTLYIGSLSRVGVSRASPISIAVYPLLTVLLAVILLQEPITLLAGVGSVLIVVGVWLVATAKIGSPVTLPATEPARFHAQAESVPAGPVRRSARTQPVGAATLTENPAAAARGSQFFLGLAMVLGASALWAIASIWLRGAGDGVHPVLAQAVRVPAAVLVTAPLAGAAGLGFGLGRHGARTVAALVTTGVLGTGVGSILFVIAVQDAGAARTAVLSCTTPLFALPMAALGLRERVPARVIIGTAISFAGILLVL